MPKEEEQVVEMLRFIVTANQEHRIVAYIELVTGYIKPLDKKEEDRENRQPAHQMFKFGKGVGVIVGALRMAGIEPTEVSPRTWQKPYYVNLAKQDGVRRSRTERKRILHDIAQRQFPQIQVTLKTADALLIYSYAIGQVSQELKGLEPKRDACLPTPFAVDRAGFQKVKTAIAKV